MATSQPGSDDELGPVDFLTIEFPGGRLRPGCMSIPMVAMSATSHRAADPLVRA